jgi:hypothetical protein
MRVHIYYTQISGITPCGEKYFYNCSRKLAKARAMIL